MKFDYMLALKGNYKVCTQLGRNATIVVIAPFRLRRWDTKTKFVAILESASSEEANLVIEYTVEGTPVHPEQFPEESYKLVLV